MVSHVHYCRTMRPEKLFIALLGLLLVCLVRGSPANSKSTQSGSFGNRSTRPNELSRRIQSWMIKRRAIPKSRSLSHTKPTKETGNPGSIFTFQRPTKANVGRWFCVDEDPGSPKCMLQRRFNHDSVGMTNPSVTVTSSTKHSADDNLLLTVSSSPEKINSRDDENRWWPSLSFAPTEPLKWRVKKYRQKVGTGVDCYSRVRDAVLDWEFRCGDDMGILPVTTPTAPHRPTNNEVIIRGRYTVRPTTQEDDGTMDELPMHQCIGAARRYVSFASRQILPFLPKLYSVNPVMSVFDVVDNRAPASTFTSTAYATMRGHLLRGEERVTVILRDGNEDVEVEIVSVSRAAPTLGGRAVWPFIGEMQGTFFESQMEHLRRIGAHFTQPRLHIYSQAECRSRRRRGP